MKSLIIVCMLFGALLFFAESDVANSQVFGGRADCEYNQHEATGDCPEASDETFCTRTYVRLHNDGTTDKDWAYKTDTTWEKCRLGTQQEDCASVISGEATTLCKELPTKGFPGPH